MANVGSAEWHGVSLWAVASSAVVRLWSQPSLRNQGVELGEVLISHEYK